MRRRWPFSLILATVTALVIWRPWLTLLAQTVQGPTSETLLIRFGVTDKTPRTWRGSLEPEGNSQVLSLSGYHFQPPDQVSSRQFEFTSRLWTAGFQQIDL